MEMGGMDWRRDRELLVEARSSFRLISLMQHNVYFVRNEGALETRRSYCLL